jgi:DNA-binding MarR family transcriptional regulator
MPRVTHHRPAHARSAETDSAPARSALSGGLAEASGTCVCFHLRKTARTVTQFYDRMLAPSGLRATQFTLLQVVHRVGALPFTVLAEGLGMDRTTLTRNLRPLERDGLVRTGTGPDDRRVRVVTLTPRGEKKLAEAEPLWARAHQRMTGGLGSATWQSLRRDLSRAIAVGLEAAAAPDEA